MSDKALKASINALVEPRRTDQEALPPAKPRPAIAAGLGVGRVVRKPGASEASAGIAWPLTEASYAARTWHTAALSAQSTDGIWTFVWDLPHEITLTDGNGSSGDLVLAAPA